jgi:glycine/sarcosine/betaine reductase component B subunit
MRLELGTFPVRDIAFGKTTRYRDGLLEIDRVAVLAAVREDPRIVSAELELARPGEPVRIWPVRDVIEPRVKVDGPGTAYPGVCGRDVTTVGQGRTHRLGNVGVVEVSNVNWHDAGGDYVEQYVDMTGPWADLVPQSKLLNVCLVVEPDTALGIEAQNDAVHAATLVAADKLAACTRGLTPPEVEVFDFDTVDAKLPGVVYIWCLHSPQGMSNSLTTFCTATYGLTRLTPPWLLHPNEIVDGAVNGPYRTMFATSWTVVNNPLFLALCRRHGRDINFLGVIAFRTEWTTQREKDLMAEQAAKMAQMLGAKGALVTWDAGGNEFIEVIHTVRACERRGIKTVFLTSEDNPAGGAPTMLEPVPEADAIVTTGFFHTKVLGIKTVPAVERVIGNPLKARSPMRDTTVAEEIVAPTCGELAPPARYDDHYGFNALTSYQH